MKRIAVLASGGGTNFQAIVEAIRSGSLPVSVALLISDRTDATILHRAADAGVPTAVVDRRTHGSGLSDQILKLLPRDVELIVLAGFLSILRGDLLRRFHGRIINLHPSLLPRHGGPGMYGINVHRAVIASGDDESGCTVHIVDEGTDTGPIVLQRRLPVLSDDTPERLAARIAPLEHEAIVAAIRTVLKMD